jgi:hypothetical protein
MMKLIVVLFIAICAASIVPHARTSGSTTTNKCRVKVVPRTAYVRLSTVIKLYVAK